MKTSATKVAPGEWNFKGFTISKDESESNLWWAKADNASVETPAEDFWSLRDAKEWINGIKEVEKSIKK